MAPARRKCTFNDDLAKEFKHLEKIPHKGDSDGGVYCKLCKVTFSISNSGRSQITKHKESDTHKQNVAAKVSSQNINSFLVNSIPKQEDLLLAAKEGTLAFHTVVHDQSFTSVSCTSRLLQSFYDKKFTCAKTKCEAIVLNVLSPALLEEVKKDLDNVPFVNASIDCSNHKDVKLLPVLIRYFNADTGVQSKLVDIHSLKGETAEILTDELFKSLEKYKITDKIVSLCADNTNTNFGGINRNGKVNVFCKVKEKLKRQIVGIGCAAHIVHNSIETACDRLPFDIECILSKIYKYFSIYTVRTENLKDYCEFVNLEYKQLLPTSKTRWLSLSTSLERLLQIYEGVKSYFLSESNCPRLLHIFFESNLTEMYLWFLHAQVHVFTQAILKIEKQSISAVETVIIVKNLISALSLRKNEMFIGLKAKEMLRKLVSEGEITEKVFHEFVGEFYSVAIRYLENWMKPFEHIIDFTWTTLSNPLSWNLIEQTLIYMNNLKVCAISESELFNEYAAVQAYINNARITDWESRSLAPADRWVETFKHLKSEDISFGNMLKIIQYSFTLPGTNASVERVFSLINNYWSPEKSNLSRATLNAVINLKVNTKLTCQEYYEYLKSNPTLLRRIHSQEKYSTVPESEPKPSTSKST